MERAASVVLSLCCPASFEHLAPAEVTQLSEGGSCLRVMLLCCVGQRPMNRRMTGTSCVVMYTYGPHLLPCSYYSKQLVDVGGEIHSHPVHE